MGGSYPLLHTVEILAADVLEEGGKGKRLEIWPVLAGTGVRSVFHGYM